ncbi:MAG: hypothetical protein SFV21_00180 [Rhodospirillaceae bacterium]|nr:hypothetical protein [Rhodospirillaceae bacterium]
MTQSTYYNALRVKWPTVAGADTAARLAALNAETVAGPPRDVRTSEVLGFLALAGLTTAIEDWVAANPMPSAARTAAKELLRIISSPHVQSIETSAPAKLAVVDGMLSALVAASVITAEHKTALLALAATTRPWWQASGYTAPISANDLDAAGL